SRPHAISTSSCLAAEVMPAPAYVRGPFMASRLRHDRCELRLHRGRSVRVVAGADSCAYHLWGNERHRYVRAHKCTVEELAPALPKRFECPFEPANWHS